MLNIYVLYLQEYSAIYIYMITGNIKNQWINSKVYPALLKMGVDKNVDGDALVAVYAILLNKRNASHCYIPIKNESNRKVTEGYRLLSKVTGLSLTTINKYVPILEEMGLCYAVKGADGSFRSYFMLGIKKIEELYAKDSKNKKKKVCIKVGGSLSDVKTSSMSVRIMSNIVKEQPRAIEKKKTLSKIKWAISQKNRLVSKKDLDKLKKAEEEGLNFKKVQKITILSNKGFERLLTNDSEKGVSGKYWKKKLIENDYIISRRRFNSVWSQKMTYNQFLSCKKTFTDLYGHVTYRNGRVCTEQACEVMPSNFYTKGEISENLPIFVYNTSYIVDLYMLKNKNISKKTFDSKAI